MCELFGISADHRIKLNSYLKVFGEHSKEHPNGWGYVSFGNSDTSGIKRISLIKEPVAASHSLLFRAMLESDIKDSCAIAHIRYATVGNVEYDNCHPFSERTEKGRVITMAHNGTIFQSQNMNRYLRIQRGETDSERVLLYLIDKIDRIERDSGCEMTQVERCEFFNMAVGGLSEGNKLNLLFFDGDCLYAHTNCRDTMYCLKKENAVMIATTPLSDEKWEPFPLFKLCAFRDGSLIYEGRSHGHEYIPNEEDLKYLYIAYSGL